MIDLELERKAFNDWHFLTYGEFVNWPDDAPASWIHNDRWKGWISSAESKQAEIDSLKAQLRELNDIVQHLKTESSGVHAALREQQRTNEDLLEKLFGVEAGEYVIVPKEPTEAMIKHAYGTYEGATILPYSFYKAMIEAAQENSHE